LSTHINKKSHQPEPVSAKADSSNKEENQCQRDKTELLTTLHVKGKLVTLPLDGKVPA
ncbi:hypothetical protein BMETH_2421117267, partial [methanotrophic bacterial endosymbiont of Bathymodiolus sp.]